MMLQVTSVALLNEAKVLAHPASIDNVPNRWGQRRSRLHGYDCRDEVAFDR